MGIFMGYVSLPEGMFFFNHEPPKQPTFLEAFMVNI